MNHSYLSNSYHYGIENDEDDEVDDLEDIKQLMHQHEANKRAMQPSEPTVSADELIVPSLQNPSLVSFESNVFRQPRTLKEPEPPVPPPSSTQLPTAVPAIPLLPPSSSQSNPSFATEPRAGSATFKNVGPSFNSSSSFGRPEPPKAPRWTPDTSFGGTIGTGNGNDRWRSDSAPKQARPHTHQTAWTSHSSTSSSNRDPEIDKLAEKYRARHQQPVVPEWNPTLTEEDRTNPSLVELARPTNKIGPFVPDTVHPSQISNVSNINDQEQNQGQRRYHPSTSSFDTSSTHEHNVPTSGYRPRVQSSYNPVKFRPDPKYRFNRKQQSFSRPPARPSNDKDDYTGVPMDTSDIIPERNSQNNFGSISTDHARSTSNSFDSNRSPGPRLSTTATFASATFVHKPAPKETPNASEVVGKIPRIPKVPQAAVQPDVNPFDNTDMEELKIRRRELTQLLSRLEQSLAKYENDKCNMIREARGAFNSYNNSRYRSCEERIKTTNSDILANKKKLDLVWEAIAKKDPELDWEPAPRRVRPPMPRVPTEQTVGSDVNVTTEDEPRVSSPPMPTTTKPSTSSYAENVARAAAKKVSENRKLADMQSKKPSQLAKKAPLPKKTNEDAAKKLKNYKIGKVGRPKVTPAPPTPSPPPVQSQHQSENDKESPYPGFELRVHGNLHVKILKSEKLFMKPVVVLEKLNMSKYQDMLTDTYALARLNTQGSLFNSIVKDEPFDWTMTCPRYFDDSGDQVPITINSDGEDYDDINRPIQAKIKREKADTPAARTYMAGKLFSDDEEDDKVRKDHDLDRLIADVDTEASDDVNNKYSGSNNTNEGSESKAGYTDGKDSTDEITITHQAASMNDGEKQSQGAKSELDETSNELVIDDRTTDSLDALSEGETDMNDDNTDTSVIVTPSARVPDFTIVPNHKPTVESTLAADELRRVTLNSSAIHDDSNELPKSLTSTEDIAETDVSTHIESPKHNLHPPNDDANDLPNFQTPNLSDLSDPLVHDSFHDTVD